MIRLPALLQEKIDHLIADKSSATLQTAYAQMSQRYHDQQARQSGFAKDRQGQDEVLAYIAARLPATYAAVVSVLNNLPLDMPIHHILDLGAGPGTATLAALDVLAKQSRISLSDSPNNTFTATLVEQDPRMIALSQILLNAQPINPVFEQYDLRCPIMFRPHDLVILSYVLNEHPLKKQMDILRQAWEKTIQALVIVLPGTPHHFQQLLVLRQWLIDHHAVIVAPCPHNRPCPLQQGQDVQTENPDWCHFSVRTERSTHHRQLKQAALPYEDEKFSYLIASRHPYPQQARLIRSPLMRKGHVIVDVCGPEKIDRQIITKRQKDHYQSIQKFQWGDPFPAEFATIKK